MLLNRREALALGISAKIIAAAESKHATPSEVLGPFFKKGAPDAKLLRKPGAPGQPLQVRGTVYNTRGDVVPEARVDFWHADDHGDYDTQGFNFRTKLKPNAKGLYEVETIMPGHYPDRPAQHIHYLITAPGHKTLVTQAYFASDPFFEGDPKKNYKKRNIVSDPDLIRPVVDNAMQFDIVLERL